jgi:cytochrome c oxidase subunit 1
MTVQAAPVEEPVVRPRPHREIFGLPLALLLTVVGFLVGVWIGDVAVGGRDYVTASDSNDAAILLGYGFAVAGFFIGLGFANFPVMRLLGRPIAPPVEETTGWQRYLRLSTDHKVIGIQYIFGTLFFFFVGGLNAMFIRAELMSNTPTLWTPGQYISLVGLHGTMMIIMMSAAVLGPFGNYLVPLMIGARGMAFPRLEALTFWLIPPAGIVLMSAVFLGGFPTGWTGYMALGDQGRLGMDSYLVAFTLIAFAMMFTGINILVTVMTMRAPGLTYDRIPIFVWGVLGTSVLMTLAPPMLLAALGMGMMDRSMETTFFLSGTGGTPFLWENLFWFFGHPEVYILALPGFGIVLEILPVFARKPLWSYRLAVAGILGVTLLSFMVWQHHLFVSGIDANLRPFYMLTTELISIPTSFIFLIGMGTLWRGNIRFTVPMLFSLAFFFNFLIGGISGVWLSDVPSDVTTHGTYFVMAHFHYTIVGGLVFAMMGAFYFWIPKMTGYMLSERLGKWHFWVAFISFNTTFLPLFAIGIMGMPRRVSTYAGNLQPLNIWVSINAFVFGFSMLLFLINLVWSLFVARVPAPRNPWNSRGLEWLLPTPVPTKNFEEIPTILSGPYEYGNPNASPVAVLTATPAEPANVE